jgi:hypothetical protein
MATPTYSYVYNNVFWQNQAGINFYELQIFDRSSQIFYFGGENNIAEANEFRNISGYYYYDRAI